MCFIFVVQKFYPVSIKLFVLPELSIPLSLPVFRFEYLSSCMVRLAPLFYSRNIYTAIKAKYYLQMSTHPSDVELPYIGVFATC